MFSKINSIKIRKPRFLSAISLYKKKKPDCKENREVIRRNFRLPVSYRIKNKESFNWELTEALNISSKGLCVTLPKSLPKGTPLDFEFQLPHRKEKTKISGKISWTKNHSGSNRIFQNGICFDDFDTVFFREKSIYEITNQQCLVNSKKKQEITIKPVENLTELTSAFHLVYKEYRRCRICPQNNSQMYFTFFNLLPESQTFIIKQNQNITGTISLMIDSSFGLPLDSICLDEISTLRKPHRKLAEVGLLAIDSDIFPKNKIPFLNIKKQIYLFNIFKLMFDYARFNCFVTDLIIGVHPKHETLYKYLQFDQIGPVRSYPGALGKPALPMHMDILKIQERNKSILFGPGVFFIQRKTSPLMLEKKFQWSKESFNELLIQNPSIVNLFTQKQKNYLSQANIIN